jgi:hypothetical protein
VAVRAADEKGHRPSAAVAPLGQPPREGLARQRAAAFIEGNRHLGRACRLQEALGFVVLAQVGGGGAAFADLGELERAEPQRAPAGVKPFGIAVIKIALGILQTAHGRNDEAHDNKISMSDPLGLTS